jgi:hypothetical protein
MESSFSRNVLARDGREGRLAVYAELASAVSLEDVLGHQLNEI